MLRLGLKVCVFPLTRPILIFVPTLLFYGLTEKQTKSYLPTLTFLKRLDKQFINCRNYKHNAILIITLFQEDNIFGTNATLTYGPQIQRHAFDNYWKKLIFLQYAQSRWGLRTPSMLRTAYATLLACVCVCVWGGVWFIQSQDQQVLSHVVWEC